MIWVNRNYRYTAEECNVKIYRCYNYEEYQLRTHNFGKLCYLIRLGVPLPDAIIATSDDLLSVIYTWRQFIIDT